MSAQTCDRIITGRNFDYASALNIIQSETYLEQEDLNEIGLYHRQGEVLQAIENFENKITDEHEFYGRRQKRQTDNDEEERIAEDFDFEIEEFKERHNRIKRYIYNVSGIIPTIHTCSGNCTEGTGPTLPGMVI